MEVNGIGRLYNEDELRAHYQQEGAAHYLNNNNASSALNSTQLHFSEEAFACLFNTSDSLDFLSRFGDGNGTAVISHSIHGTDGSGHSGPLICSRSWDGILCWPETAAGAEAVLPCFDRLNGVRYDTSRPATRICDADGTWQNRTDYTMCLPLPSPPIGNDTSLNITTGVYLAGYTLSLFFLIIAIVVFIAFKELRCLRNKIHTHLMLTYILADALWIITNFTSYQTSLGGSGHVSCVTFILLHYVHLTNFFWMFVEGLYLYVLVVQTFIADNIKLRVYAFIGWGIPLMVVIGWSVAKWMTQSMTSDSNMMMNDPEFAPIPPTCLWLNVSIYDWIYKTPVVIVLAANIGFLFQIMWVLITKLRSAMNPETQQSRKAAKALLVLMPLLGITYVLILTGSKQTPIYEYLRALLISTQGFLVALLYCFLNGEVRVALRHHWNRIRAMGPDCICCGCEFEGRQHMQQMRDWSPRSRTESIRLYTPSGQVFRKRESTASDATSMTILGPVATNGNNPVQTMAYLNKHRRMSTSVATGSPASTQRLLSVTDTNTFV